MRRRHIDIYLANKKSRLPIRREVLAYEVVPGLAIHRDLAVDPDKDYAETVHDLWNVTHIRSGKTIGGLFTNALAAARFARDMGGLANWDRREGDIPDKADLSTKARFFAQFYPKGEI